MEEKEKYVVESISYFGTPPKAPKQSYAPSPVPTSCPRCHRDSFFEETGQCLSCLYTKTKEPIKLEQDHLITVQPVSTTPDKKESLIVEQLSILNRTLMDISGNLAILVKELRKK